MHLVSDLDFYPLLHTSYGIGYQMVLGFPLTRVLNFYLVEIKILEPI